MNAVVQRIEPETAHLPAAASETSAIVQMIERAASNPAVDIDKMERLLSMQERVLERQARAAYFDALATVQPLLPVVQERGAITKTGGGVSSTYALWEDINAAILPVLSQNGFAITFRTGRSVEGQITVTGVLTHRGGHSEETTLTLPVDSSGSKNAVQAVGSSTAYGKRYTAAALLNLTTKGEDDDGQAGGARGQSALATAAISSLNDCASVADLHAWKSKNEAIIKGADFPEKDRKAVRELYVRRLAALKPKGDGQ